MYVWRVCVCVCVSVCVCVCVCVCGPFTHVCATQLTTRSSCSQISTSQLVKKFSHILSNPIFISVFTTLCPYPYKTHPGHNLQAYFFKIYFNLIFHLHLSFPYGLLRRLLRRPRRTCMHFSSFPYISYIHLTSSF